MPKLTPFEAPMTGYNISSEGSSAYARAAATAREAGSQRAQMLHQEGRSIEEGMKVLGRGMGDYNKDQDPGKAKVDAHEELLNATATQDEASKTYDSLLQSYQKAETAAMGGDLKAIQKWKDEVYSPAKTNLLSGAINDKDGTRRLSHVESMDTYFRTKSAASQLEAETGFVKNGYNSTKASVMTSVVGGGQRKPDGSELTLLNGLNRMDTAVTEAVKTGVQFDYKKLTDAHSDEQHGLVMASAEAWIKSATTPEEAQKALDDVLDPERAWRKNPYGVKLADKDAVEKLYDKQVVKIKSVQTSAHTAAQQAATTEYNKTTNDMMTKVKNRTYNAATDDKLDDVLAKHGAFIKADDVAAFRKNITWMQNHPNEGTVTDIPTYEALQKKATQGKLTPVETAQAVFEKKITEDNMKSLDAINDKVSKFGNDDHLVTAAMKDAEFLYGRADMQTGFMDFEDRSRFAAFRPAFYKAMTEAKEAGKWDNARDLDPKNPDGIMNQVGKRFWRTDAERATDMLGLRGRGEPVAPSRVPPTLQGFPPNKLIEDPKTGDIYNTVDKKTYNSKGVAYPEVPRSQ